MLQYNPSISGSLSVTGSLIVTNGMIGTISGIDVQVFSSSINQVITGIQSSTGSSDAKFETLSGVTSSALTRLTNIESKSASVDISVSNINSFTASNGNASLNTYTGSNDTKFTTLGTYTGSLDTKNTTLGSVTSSLISKTGSYATTGSNSFYGTQVFSGSVYIANDLVVQGSSSIQYISASSVSLGTNIIQLNTANPSVRFAGLTMIDSGSIGGSGSFLYDSLQDEFIFVHRGNGTNITSSHFVLGPETYDGLGNETYLTCNRLSKGTGKEHLVDSTIFDDGTTVCVNATLKANGQVCSLMGNFGCAGIGTSSPNFKIHVSTGDTTSITQPTAGTYGLYVQQNTAGNVGGIYIQDGASNSGNSIYVGDNNGAARFVIDTDGKVGIGIGSPGQILDIQSAASIIRLKSTTGTNSVYTNYENCSNFYVGTDSTSGGSFGKACSAVLWQVSCNSIVFATSNTEQMRITGDGNVGIGITANNPIGNGGTYRNLLVGNGAGYGVFQGISTATASSSTIVAFSGGTTGASDFKNGGSINLELDGTSTSRAIGRWSFYTNNASSFTEKMRITSNGCIKIGACAIAANSNAALQVAGSIRFGNPDGDYLISYAGGISGRNINSLSPGSFTILHKGLGDSGFLLQVQGFYLSNKFTDIVYGIASTVCVLGSANGSGTPPIRSYSITSENLNICISGGTAYQIISQGFNAAER